MICAILKKEITKDEVFVAFSDNVISKEAVARLPKWLVDNGQIHNIAKAFYGRNITIESFMKGVWVLASSDWTCSQWKNRIYLHRF